VLVLMGVSGVFLAAPPMGLSADPPGMAAMAAKVNINTATVEQLTTLPGVGEAIAQAIVDYRDNNGAFRSADDLLQVKGIGEKKLEGIRGMVVVK
jgi:competence protein ComEA